MKLQSHADDRRAWLPPLVLAAVLMAGLRWSVVDYWDPKADGARYIATALSLARGDGYRYAGEPFTLRPPGFSALLTPIVAWRGLDFGALNFAVSLFGIVATLLFFLFVRARTSWMVALAAALVVWTNPAFQRLCNQVLSDVPSLALALLAVRLAERTPSARGDALVAVTIAAAMYVRTANVALLPALLLNRLCRRRNGTTSEPLWPFVASRLVMPVSLVVLLWLPWASYAGAHAPRGAAEITKLHSYSTAYLRIDPGDPDSPVAGPREWGERMRRNGAAYIALIGSGLESAEPSPGRTALTLLGIGCWLAVLWRRRGMAEWFVGVTLVMLVLYFFYDTRLALPAYVLIVAAAAECLYEGARRLRPESASMLATAVLAVFAAMHVRANPMPPDAPARYRDLVTVANFLRHTTNPEETLGGDIGPVYGLLIDQPVRSLRVATRQGGLGTALAEIERLHITRVAAERGGACEPLIVHALSTGMPVQTFGRYVVIDVRPN